MLTRLSTALRRGFGIFLIGLGIVLFYDTWMLWRTTLDNSGWIEKGHFAIPLLALLAIFGGLLFARKEAPPKW